MPYCPKCDNPSYLLDRLENGCCSECGHDPEDETEE